MRLDAVFSLMFVCFFATSFASALEPSRPNVILVMADDQGWGDTSYNGHPELKTPNLDEMAAAGLRLNRFYIRALQLLADTCQHHDRQASASYGNF